MVDSYRESGDFDLVRIKASCMPAEALKCHCAYCWRKGQFGMQLKGLGCASSPPGFGGGCDLRGLITEFKHREC
jgi:hypothetical protein